MRDGFITEQETQRFELTTASAAIFNKAINNITATHAFSVETLKYLACYSNVVIIIGLY